MLEAEAIKEIRELGSQADGKVVEVEGRPYSERDLRPIGDPEPAELTVHTLTGVVDYLQHDVDGLPPGELLLHVEGPRQISLRGRLSETFQQRFCYVSALCLEDEFPFGSFIGTEELIIRLQSQFVDTGDRADVLRLIGTVKDEQVQTRKDDGHTQKVAASAGVTLAESVEVPNPVDLAPYRTFPEIEQPSSPFVLRVRKGREGIEAGLFEADGGAWRNEAIDRIASWLKPGVEVPIIS